MKIQVRSSTPDAEWHIVYCARASSPGNQQKMNDGTLEAVGLLKYLIKEKHWSPFEMANVLVEIETTRAISAQMLRHRSFAFQEFSQRYAKVGDIPLPEMRIKSEKNRQSSTEVIDDECMKSEIRHSIILSLSVYNELLDDDVAPETARMILPMCTPTKLYMNGTVRSWIHYFEVRCKEETQKEHREVALEIRRQLSKLLPICAEALGWTE